MSKKMWNKIFKSKTNKNSKALQAANKINKRTSIYEEYQQLNAALDSGPINDKFKDKTKTASLDATTALHDNDTDKTTPKTTTATTFSKVVSTLTLKRSQNSNTSKDARNENESKKKNLKTSELNIETLSTTSLPANKTNNQNVVNCNSNNNKNNITYSNSKNINSSTVTLNHCNFNTTCNTSLNQQQTLTEFKATAATGATAASLNSKLNNINNNDYIACKQNLTNPPTPTSQPPPTLLQPQKRLSKIVIVVKKLHATTTTTTTTTATATTTAATQSAPRFVSELATNLNKQNQIFCIDRTNNSSTNNDCNKNHDNGSWITTISTNNTLGTSIEATPTFETPAAATTTTTTTPSSSTAINEENQLSMNFNNDAKETARNSDRYGTFLQKEDHNDHQQKQQQYEVDNGNNITTPTEVPETNASVELAPCAICSRTFNPATLRKHVGICEKTAMKKRNIFDSSRQRREGTDLATYCLPKNFGLPEKTTSTTSITQSRNDRGHSPKPNVQQVSSPILKRKKPPEDLMRTTARASMRKAVASSNNNSTSSIAVASTPSHNFNRDRMRSSERSLTRIRGIQLPPAEQCPHCERCFGIKAYDRHVEWCKEKALLASIKQSSSKNEGNVAKARLEARTKYRAPCLKTKRSINREKYSGLANEDHEPEDSSKCSKTSVNKTQEDNFMCMSMTSSVCSERNIMNSTTGNINEPAAAKENKNKPTVRSLVNAFVTKFKTQQPPTKTAKEKPIAAKKAEKGEKYSKSNAQQWKTADVQMNLEQKKSASDLSAESMLREKCWQQTHKTFEVVSDIHDERNCHYDNESNFDEMKFEANQKSKDCLEFSKSLKKCGPTKILEKNESNEINLQEYIDANFSNFDKQKSHNNNKRNIKSNNCPNKDAKELLVVEAPLLRRDLSPKFCYSTNKADQILDNKDFAGSKISDKPKSSRTQSSKKVAVPKTLKKQVTYDKIMAAKSKSSENEKDPITCKFNEDNSQTNEFFTEIEMFKDCLTDSDELRGPKNSESITAHNLVKDPLTKSNSNTNTFIRKLNENLCQLQQFAENYNEKPLAQNTENCKNVSFPNAARNPSTTLAPNKDCLPSSLLPQISPLLLNFPRPDTNRLLPLKICSSKRKKLLRPTASCTNSSSCPMKAFVWSLSMEQLQLCGTSSAASIKSGKDNRQQEIECNDKNCHTIEENSAKKKPNKEIKVIKEPPQLKRNSSFTVIGLPDNYDPFLSAKRQLEELCSPSADSVELQNIALTPKLPSLPATPNNNSKMTTSLILSSPAATNTTPSLMTTSQIPQQTPKTPVLARSSSFRRTSSLRGPRRSPMLSTRPPLFAQKHRPTIQRGLSDEGPISTNFLKPEEYDEMPVRSVCVNDFAINKSPRVVRRDTSASNRKQPLKLNINAANNSNSNCNTGSPQVVEAEILNNNNTASKYVSKTDSLAVFLKFEHELENLNTSAAPEEEVRKTGSSFGTPSSNLDGPLNAKELKDKSNNLSKQNSNKNIKADILAAASADNDNNNSQFCPNDLEAGSKYGALRLAPLNTKTSTPLSTKPSTPQLTQQPSLSARQSTPVNAKNSPDQNAFKSSKPVALSSLFGSESKTSKQTSLFYTERQHSNGSDYIDPKLINKCDNLPIHLNLKRTDYKYTDTDATETRLEQFSSSSSESTSQQQHHNNLLPLMKQQSKHEHTESNNLYATSVTQPVSHTATNSQRNSAEGRNLLKRRMRVGRNQFLYDASPEADSCSADDEGANRSSLEGDASKRQLDAAAREREKAFERLSSAQFQPVDAPFIPPLPAFDDFDFEEFLSSFENDEEQFPLFKDCREFLMNRTSKKQRSMLMPNSVAPTNQTNTLSSTAASCKKSPSPHTFPPLTPQKLATNEQPQQQLHFQFPSLNQPAKNHFNSFSLNNRARNKFEDLVDSKSTDTFCIEPTQREEYRTLDSQSLSQKREIFISIETEQNDSDKSALSPNSIRHMVGNPQTVVEVEVDAAHDSKFSKISDDDEAADGLQEPNSRSKNFAEHLPNVQLNNAKNLMQKMQEDFCQLGEDMSANLRLSKELRTDPADLNSGLSGTARNAMKINRTPGCPSGDAYGDSDELSSLDGYPLSSPSSRLGVSSKTSADSAYGSLSRQRSSELSTQRSSSRNRSMATNTANTLINRPLTEESSLTRLRQLSASSSSSSEHALPPINKSNSNNSNSAYHKQHIQHPQQLQHNFNSNNNNNNLILNLNDAVTYELNNNYNNSGSHYDNQTSLANLTGANNSQTNLESLQQFTSSSTMSTSMKMSKFCHECGSKFILEQAKFCMDCGVKRVVL